MKHTSLGLCISSLIIVFMVGIGFGYFLTPEYQSQMYDKNSMSMGAADRWVDLRYMNAMIAHHRSAILLAEQAERQSRRPEVVELAKTIQSSEPKLIAELYQMKKDAYGDVRPVRDPSVPQLGEWDKTFDLRFLNALISHHEDGIVMTREIRLKTSRSSTIDNADAVENFLKSTLIMLKGWRSDWYKS